MTRSDELRAAFYAWRENQIATEAALNALLMSMRPVITATVRSTLRSRPGLIDDAAQEAMTYCWKHLHLCRADVVPWCRAIARSKAIDAIRQRGEEQPLVDEDGVEIEPLSEQRRADSSVDFGLLTEQQREVANLFIQGYTQREVQHALHLSRPVLDDLIAGMRASRE